jgi:hypothetical protein
LKFGSFSFDFLTVNYHTKFRKQKHVKETCCSFNIELFSDF